MADKPSAAAEKMRRFYQQSPARHTKYVTQFYDALAEATEARRNMRHMDRMYRPRFADELEHSRENLEYNQLSNANKSMRGISAEMRAVLDPPDLRTLRTYADSVARERHIGGKIGKIKLGKAWKDQGDMKRALLDMWVAERNDLAKRVMLDIEGQRMVAQ